MNIIVVNYAVYVCLMNGEGLHPMVLQIKDKVLHTRKTS